jgi:hypothetical protein
MSHGAEGFNVSIEELDALVEQARPALDDAGYQKLKAAVRTLSVMTAMLESPGTTVQSLRNMFGRGTNEKTATVLKNAGIHTEKPSAPARPKAPGHGRNGANAYRGAHRVQVPHPSLRSGDRCPDCQQGKVYLQREPGVLVRLIGRAPIEATIYALEKLRCNLCGEVFTAKAPDGIGSEKYDMTVGSMIAILRYGRGFPMHRLEKLEHSLGIPLPASVPVGDGWRNRHPDPAGL